MAFFDGQEGGSKTFPAAWMPSMLLKRQTPPLVLTVFLRRRNSSPRWMQVVELYQGHFTHHLDSLLFETTWFSTLFKP